MLRERGSIIQRYIRAIAFTDIRDPKVSVFKWERDLQSAVDYTEQCKLIKRIYKECARNWIKTKRGKKLDAPCKMEKGTLVERVSSGHADHKYTTPSAFPSVIRFFEEKMNAITDQ